MVDDHEPAVARAAIHFRHDSIRRGADIISIVRRNIHSGVERTLTAERVEPLAEMPRKFSYNGPQGRDDSQRVKLFVWEEPHSSACHCDGGRVLLEVAEFLHRLLELRVRFLRCVVR